MATLFDIAQCAGVAKSTVSRCLRNDPTLSLSDETRKKIFACAAECGYVAKHEKLDSDKKHIVIVHRDRLFLNQIDNAYYFSMRSAIEDACRNRGYSFTFTPLQFLDSVTVPVDGVIIVSYFTYEEMAGIFSAFKTPNLVYIGQYNHFPDKTDWIAYEAEDCVDMALSHLRSTAHRSVMYIGPEPDSRMKARYQKIFHYRQYMRDHSDLYDEGELFCEYDVESGYRAFSDWFKTHTHLPHAFFTAADPIAIGVLRALNEQHIPVPQDVSVISINGDAPAAYTFPQLTTVSIHRFEMGSEAVTALSERISGLRSQAKKVVFPPTLIVRASVSTER